MKTLLMKLTFFTIFWFFSTTLHSQVNDSQSTFTVIKDGANYNDSEINSFMSAVYLNCPEYINESLAQVHKGQLSRFQIVRASQPELIQVYGNLQSLGIKQKCNPAITLDTEINQETFNPLKYFFNFYPEQDTFIYSGREDIYFRIVPEN